MTLPSTEYRLIPLTQGQFAKVSPEDFDWLMQWKWGALWDDHSKGFYARHSFVIEGKKRGSIKMHRLILGLAKGDKRHADHENHDTLDNRRSNLRIATLAESSQNRRIRKDSKIGFKGVSDVYGRYQAKITVNGKTIHLGYRSTAEAAHRELYVPAAEKYHGKFARTK